MVIDKTGASDCRDKVPLDTLFFFSFLLITKHVFLLVNTFAMFLCLGFYEQTSAHLFLFFSALFFSSAGRQAEAPSPAHMSPDKGHFLPSPRLGLWCVHIYLCAQSCLFVKSQEMSHLLSSYPCITSAIASPHDDALVSGQSRADVAHLMQTP